MEGAHWGRDVIVLCVSVFTVCVHTQGNERMKLRKEVPGFHSDRLSCENTTEFVKDGKRYVCVSVCMCARTCVSPGGLVDCCVLFFFWPRAPFSPLLSLIPFLGSFF